MTTPFVNFDCICCEPLADQKLNPLYLDVVLFLHFRTSIAALDLTPWAMPIDRKRRSNHSSYPFAAMYTHVRKSPTKHVLKMDIKVSMASNNFNRKTIFSCP